MGNPNQRLELCLREAFPAAILVAVSLILALHGLGESGPLWPDAPRYANAGAFFHDYFLSGDLLQPYRFAEANYAQYPAFSMPFHPPAYPALLGICFVLFGMSYTVARVLVALCLGATLCGFFAIQRQFGVRTWPALLSALLLATTPEVARWSRDTMSEIPSWAFLLVATWSFLRWWQDGRLRDLWIAFALAEVAFLSRVTTIGIIPAWCLFVLCTRRSRCSWRALVPLVVYLVLNVAWVMFAARYSRYEMAADGKAEILSWRNLRYFPECLPDMAWWGTTVVALAALLCLAWYRQSTMAVRFWLCWLLGYAAFKLVMPTTSEVRHFLNIIPALAGLSVALFDVGLPHWLRRRLAPSLGVTALVVNGAGILLLPHGLVGYEQVGEQLARLPRPGNVLLASWHDQDLIFRYRSQQPEATRQMLRSDRTLAIRVSDYARHAAAIKVTTVEQFLELIEQGRVRYLVTCVPDDPAQDDRPEEMRFVHETVLAHSERFQNLGRFPLLVQFGGRGMRGQVFLWEFTGALPEGASTLPVVIPTAGMEIGRS